MRNKIDRILFKIYSAIGMDKPENHDGILDFIVNDIQETADPIFWHSGDVGIAFRRWIEAQTTQPDEIKEETYFKIINNSFNKKFQGEEINIRGGVNANISIVKIENCFIICFYNQARNFTRTTVVWEHELVKV